MTDKKKAGRPKNVETPTIKKEKVQVEFKIFNNSSVVYFDINDEEAKISELDKSKLRTAIVKALKSVDGKYIYNEDSARKALSAIEKEKLENSVLAHRAKLIQDEDRKNKEDQKNAETPDRKSTRLNSSHSAKSRMPSSA